MRVKSFPIIAFLLLLPLTIDLVQATDSLSQQEGDESKVNRWVLVYKDDTETILADMKTVRKVDNNLIVWVRKDYTKNSEEFQSWQKFVHDQDRSKKFDHVKESIEIDCTNNKYKGHYLAVYTKDRKAVHTSENPDKSVWRHVLPHTIVEWVKELLCPIFMEGDETIINAKGDSSYAEMSDSNSDISAVIMTSSGARGVYKKDKLGPIAQGEEAKRLNAFMASREQYVPTAETNAKHIREILTRSFDQPAPAPTVSSDAKVYSEARKGSRRIYTGSPDTGQNDEPDRSRTSRSNVNKDAINTRTGEVYPGSGPGVINPRTGEYYPKSGPGFINPRTGEIYPEN